MRTLKEFIKSLTKNDIDYREVEKKPELEKKQKPKLEMRSCQPENISRYKIQIKDDYNSQGWGWGDTITTDNKLISIYLSLDDILSNYSPTAMKKESIEVRGESYHIDGCNLYFSFKPISNNTYLQGKYQLKLLRDDVIREYRLDSSDYYGIGYKNLIKKSYTVSWSDYIERNPCLEIVLDNKLKESTISISALQILDDIRQLDYFIESLKPSILEGITKNIEEELKLVEEIKEKERKIKEFEETINESVIREHFISLIDMFDDVKIEKNLNEDVFYSLILTEPDEYNPYQSYIYAKEVNDRTKNLLFELSESISRFDEFFNYICKTDLLMYASNSSNSITLNFKLKNENKN